MTDSEKAVQTVERFIGNAKDVAVWRYERALFEIHNLKWWQRWRATRIARKALGICEFWNTEEGWNK